METIRAFIGSYLMHTYYVLNLGRKLKCPQAGTANG